MTKSELIEQLTERFPQLGVKDADLAVKMILDEMAACLARGQRIEIRGFGSFEEKYIVCVKKSRSDRLRQFTFVYLKFRKF